MFWPQHTWQAWLLASTVAGWRGVHWRAWWGGARAWSGVQQTADGNFHEPFLGLSSKSCDNGSGHRKTMSGRWLIMWNMARTYLPPKADRFIRKVDQFRGFLWRPYFLSHGHISMSQSTQLHLIPISWRTGLLLKIVLATAARSSSDHRASAKESWKHHKENMLGFQYPGFWFAVLAALAARLSGIRSANSSGVE